MVSDTDYILKLRKTTKTQANYQFVVMHKLINATNAMTKEDILKELSANNNGKRFTMSNTPVFEVLKNKKYIKVAEDLIISMIDFDDISKAIANKELKRLKAL